MKNNRRNHSAAFKAKVALAAIKGDKTTAELMKQYQVHATQITQWKKQLADSLPEIFSLRRNQDQQKQQALTDQLYQQIGQLKVELDWLEVVCIIVPAGTRSIMSSLCECLTNNIFRHPVMVLTK